MNTNELKKLTENILETFLKAGKRAIKLRQEGLKTSFKSDNSPVTNGDLEVDKLLREKINKVTPGIPLISEETVNLNKDNRFPNFWEFLCSLGEFTV